MREANTKTLKLIAVDLILCASCYLAAAAAAEQRNATREAEVAAAGYLLGGAQANEASLFLFEASNETNTIDSHLDELLSRDGPDMRPGRDFKDYKDISLEDAKRAWRLLHEQTKLSARKQIDSSWPILNELLESANVSSSCKSAVASVMLSAKNLDSWAVKMLNSWGRFPTSGIFEGTYGDVGSFYTCVDVEQVPQIGHAHYCSLTFRPVLPSMKDYELVVRKETDELLNLFNPLEQKQHQHQSAGNSTPRDAFSDLLEHVQYHHYVYYKIGSCWPIGCSPFDVRRLVRLVGKRNVLMHGPVKCYSKNSSDYEELYLEDDQVDVTSFTDLSNATQPTRNKTKLVISIWDKNKGIFIWKPFFNRGQQVALAIVVSISVFLFTMTLIDVLVNKLPNLLHKLKLTLKGLPLTDLPGRGGTFASNIGGHPQRVGFALVPCREQPSLGAARLASTPTTFDGSAQKGRELAESDEVVAAVEGRKQVSLFMSVVDDCSILTNAQQFFRVSEGQLKNDILCLNGIRCITMMWVILAHTMMYNDWSQWGRTRDIEKALNSIVIQPIFNGSYLVDSFFLMSGLLSSFTAFKHSQGLRSNFNSAAFIASRWLRLTPQIFFVSMIYIIFPALSYGPHWFPLVGEFSENCVSNWWVNVLHIQAFYKKEQMCNFVTWWISIDFFYHFLAVALIWIILIVNHKTGFASMSLIIATCVTWQAIEHYQEAYPPNLFSTIPQTGAMWIKMTLNFFWTPITHSVPFFFGFYIGYLMALKKKLIFRSLNTRRALVGWTLSIGLLIGQLYTTYWWVTGKRGYSRLFSTLFYCACSFVWASALCWIIIACQHGYGGFINKFLSNKVFIILGKCSYIVYLAHFQVLFLFFGNQNLLIEPTMVTIVFMIVGNIFLSTLEGIFLCIVFELPWLKTQRRLMKHFR